MENNGKVDNDDNDNIDNEKQWKTMENSGKQWKGESGSDRHSLPPQLRHV